MPGTYQRFRTYLALISLGLLIALFAAAGTWQLKRAEQRDNIAKQISHAATQPPANLNTKPARMPPQLWHKAKAQGQWLHKFTVLLENRNYKGQPGYWVATPFAISNTTEAIIVLRGWLPRINSGDLPALARSSINTNQATIEGRVLPRVPRALELWAWSEHNTKANYIPGTEQPIVAQNLSIADLSATTGLKLMPVVLEQTSADPIEELVTDWPDPASGASTNRGYALQWFSFCAIACGAWLTIAWRTLKKSKH